MGFAAFNNLPAEIRSMVWVYALPEPRVYEILDTPFSTLKTPASTGLMFSSGSHTAPPVLAAVCRESRAFVLRRYQPLTLSDTIKYIDPSRDIILLQPYLLIKRLLRTLHSLAEVDFMKRDLRQVAFGTSYGFSTGIYHPILSGKVSKNNMKTLVKKLARFSKLGKVLFVVHEEFKCVVSKPHRAESQLELQLLSSSFVKSQEDDQSRTNWNFRRNEIQYYPLHFEEEVEDDEPDIEGDDVELNRKPTNDDWRRFKRRFLKAVHSTLMRELQEKPRQEHLPFLIEGASIIWRYEAS
ncbi:hypothetical protein FPRO06_01155 [Fusarium proliferatum]|uniref:2EXR domain-containing protein n=2 Tax=Gibberella intermedia TaxID=948311 RepID=A0A420SBV1_GIBIN|nr:hypothetical protein FPRO03_01158 [Fusarium proliferatum]KAG4284853.1 hypothetical protein FPRO04_05235 [Fusarium proliferatum]KAG4294570.1 hypothetical protein FPRO06_01155 [Fusarium proliferatum]RKL26751.1 hypothetical protein BFJ72_g13533 [Fusarium proliferatum]CVL10266.1 uncharacterized protein FPRN_00829 [Fusarium proliferatum]